LRKNFKKQNQRNLPFEWSNNGEVPSFEVILERGYIKKEKEKKTITITKSK